MNVRMPDSPPVGLPSTPLQRRPDVRQAEQNLKAAMASAGMAYADRFPRLTISLTGGLENDALKGLINSPFSLRRRQPHRAAVRLGSKRAKYRAALAAYDQARLAYEQKVLEVFREVNDAVTAYRNMRRTAELKFNPQGGGPAIRRAGQIAVYQRRDPLHRRARRPAEVLRRTGRGEQGGAQRAPRARGVAQGPRGRWRLSDAEKRVDRKWSTLFFPSLARMRLNDCGVIQR